jgi:DUF1365 family protein
MTRLQSCLRAGYKLHARTITQKLQLLEGSLQLAMSIGEWLVMPSEVYELSRKFIALLKAGSGAALPALQWSPRTACVMAAQACRVRWC